MSSVRRSCRNPGTGRPAASRPPEQPEPPEDPGQPALPDPLETPDQLETPELARTARRVTAQRERLAQVGAVLSRLLEPKDVASLILDAACSELGAPLGWVAVVTGQGNEVEIIASVGYPAIAVRPWVRVSLDLDTPMTMAIREGRPIEHASAADRHLAYPALAARPTGIEATEGSAVVPLMIEDRAVGALAVAFRTTRALEDDERWYLDALAAQGALALERARLFAALRDRDERLRFALEASNIGTWEWDIVEDRVHWSPEVRAQHGTPADGVPLSLEAYLAQIHPGDRERLRAAVEASVRDLAPYNEEFRVVRPDGTTRWTHGVGRVFVDSAGRPIRMLGTSLDITDRKVAELDRDRLIAAEREAAQLRDAFIGVVSHELRTPITTIYGGTRVLARRWREMEPGARDDILADVVEEADRLYRMVEDLLVLTRVERGSLEIGDEPIHLGRLLERVVASEEPRWPGVTFRTEVPPGLPSVEGEETYAEQVLRNLLGNAAKYGGDGSTVTVIADADDTDVILSVLDEGPGIDEDEAERLFELFYRSPTVEDKVAGAGIGLFVCQQLVHAMGGQIRAERRPEGGAAFVVRLPRYEEEEEEEDLV